jgi:hypothetical protein
LTRALESRRKQSEILDARQQLIDRNWGGLGGCGYKSLDHKAATHDVACDELISRECHHAKERIDRDRGTRGW